MAKVDWRKAFEVELAKAMKKAGVAAEGLKWEGCTTDATWGDRCGLVFYGAALEVCVRAAKFFETWARKNLRKMGAVGGYDTQESIGFVGEFEFSRYANGANGWHAVRTLEEWEVKFRAEHPPVESYRGFATSYVYYPCAD